MWVRDRHLALPVRALTRSPTTVRWKLSYRASKLAKRESIPATVRELTDAQALELQVIENVQRVDVHPLDEAVDTLP